MTNDENFNLIKDLVNEPIDSLYLWNDGDDRDYEEIINRLIALHDPKIDDWMWNALKIREYAYSIENSSLTEEAKQLVRGFVEEKTKWNSNLVYSSKDGTKQILKSINEEIAGNRIILKPCQTKDNCDLYLSHVRDDGDYKIYVVPEKSDIIIEKYLAINSKLPHSFYVFLRETSEEIGIVSLYDSNQNHNSILKVAEAHYYIYKEYRHQGYALEAMKLLIDAFFGSRLKQNISTDKKYVFIEKQCEPICVKLLCNEDNTASNKLALKLGFKFEGTNHYYKFMDGIPQHENNYYLDSDLYNKSQRQEK